MGKLLFYPNKSSIEIHNLRTNSADKDRLHNFPAWTNTKRTRRTSLKATKIEPNSTQLSLTSHTLIRMIRFTFSSQVSDHWERDALTCVKMPWVCHYWLIWSLSGSAEVITFFSLKYVRITTPSTGISGKFCPSLTPRTSHLETGALIYQ